MLDWLSLVLISAVFLNITAINHLSLPNSCRTMTIDSTFTKKVLSMARIHLMQDDELEPHVLKSAKAALILRPFAAWQIARIYLIRTFNSMVRHGKAQPLAKP
jgi:hypothetical protein